MLRVRAQHGFAVTTAAIHVSLNNHHVGRSHLSRSVTVSNRREHLWKLAWMAAFAAMTVVQSGAAFRSRPLHLSQWACQACEPG